MLAYVIDRDYVHKRKTMIDSLNRSYWIHYTKRSEWARFVGHFVGFVSKAWLLKKLLVRGNASCENSLNSIPRETDYSMTTLFQGIMIVEYLNAS